MENKLCCRCKVQKPNNAFANNKRQKDGLHTHCRECHKLEYQQTKEYQKQYAKKWAELNKEKKKERESQYWKENKQKLIKKHLEYTKARRLNDHKYALIHNLRSRLNAVLLQKSFTKDSVFSEILGCTPQELAAHLECAFESWMTWENRGLYNSEPNYGWDVDHIIPLSSAKTEEDLIKLCHFTNLQPLCGYVNRCIKKNKIQ